MKFSLHEEIYIAECRELRGYRIGGMADGKTARIANFGTAEKPEWRIGGPGSEWVGSYETAYQALCALMVGQGQLCLQYNHGGPK
jgi:hypothetical protein